MSGGSRPLRRCVSSVWKTFIEKKKRKHRGREKNVRGCWLVYRLCIDFSLSDTLIFHMEQSALSLPAFCLCLNSVPHQHHQRLLKTKCLLRQLFHNEKPTFLSENLWATFQHIQNKPISHWQWCISDEKHAKKKKLQYHSCFKYLTLETDPVYIYSISG